jgi:hypothetical protein
MQVISAYALALTCAEMSLGCTASSEALDRITKFAVTVGGHTHWEPAPSEALSLSSARNSYGGASSTHIEMTGYGLMAMLASGRVSEGPFTSGAPYSTVHSFSVIGSVLSVLSVLRSSYSVL